MNYSYQKRSTEELEQIAEIILGRYAQRCRGSFIDIEGIVEDCELTILPREGGLRKYVDGYVAANPRYIIVAEVITSYAQRYRPVIAEELCHAILEYDILNNDGKLPKGAEPHALTSQQHDDIEADARYLARAVLFPKSSFIEAFERELKATGQDSSNDRGKLLRCCGEKLETEFQVWSLQVGYRARDLKLITDDECKQNFSDRISL